MTGLNDTNSSGELKVGAKVWIYDPNRRVYEKTKDGRSTGGPIFREHFVLATINGETPRKWKTSWCEAFKKNPYETGFLTAEQVDERVWDNEHRRNIISHIQYKATTAHLREIAKLIGYTP